MALHSLQLLHCRMHAWRRNEFCYHQMGRRNLTAKNAPVDNRFLVSFLYLDVNLPKTDLPSLSDSWTKLVITDTHNPIQAIS